MTTRYKISRTAGFVNAKLKDKEFEEVPTINAIGYQLHSIWAYKCSGESTWKFALGISFKSVEEINQADLLYMLRKADENAFGFMMCDGKSDSFPPIRYRYKIVIKQYVPVTENFISKEFVSTRLKKDNLAEFERTNKFLDFSLSYTKAKEKFNNAKKDNLISGDFYTKHDFYDLKDIILKKDMKKTDIERTKKLKLSNHKIVDLYRKIIKKPVKK